MKARLSKHTLKLREGQVAALQALHPDLAYSEVIRRIIDAYIHAAKARLGAKQTKIEVNIDV